MFHINCVKVHPAAIIPQKERGNLAFDLHVVRDEQFVHYGSDYKYILRPNRRKIFHTGLKIELPPDYGVLYRDRSGMGAKHGIHILAGCIDNSYRGEWMVSLLNTSEKNYIVIEGDRIIQAVLIPEFDLEFHEVDQISDTFRGEKGFGSSGR